MRIQQLSTAEALESLHTRPEGLVPAEAAHRLIEFGANRIERLRRVPLTVRLVRSITHFLACILWLAAGLAFTAAWYEPGTGMATLGVAIIGVILINGVFSFWQEYRAERELQALQQLLPHQVKVARNHLVLQAPAERLVPGDVVLLDAGDDVPADCRVLEAFGLRVNNATITGESLPQSRDAHPTPEENPLRSRNILLAGTSVVSGQARAVVFATGMHTEFGKIARLTQATREDLSPLQREIVRLSRIVTIFATALGGGFFLIGQAIGLSFWENFIFAIGIIVANVPEGLLPTVTLSLAMASRRMARRKALIRHLPAVETLGCATVICTDKTGTLTLNRMEVERLFLGGEFHGIKDVRRQPGLATDYRAFFETASLNHTLQWTENNGRKELLGDPMEVALVQMARDLLCDLPEYPRVDEIPFDSDRKRLSTLHQTPEGLVLFTKGALETVLPLCAQVQAGKSIVPLTQEWHERLCRAQDKMADEGLRVLAFACRRLPADQDSAKMEQSLILLGLVGLEDPPRPEVPEAIRRCRDAGIKVIMVTGDHPHTALAVGRQIGLLQSARPVVVTGEKLSRLSDTQLQLSLRASEILFARVGADQKSRIVRALKARGEVVAVTGDGVNDAPALRQADIGISMGITGTDVAREAADLVLADDNFATIVAAVEEGRAVFHNIRGFLTYILTSNVPELVPYLVFVLFKTPLALTVMQILAVDLGTDMVPALGLGAEPPDPSTMRRTPRPRTAHLLTPALLLRAYGFLGVLEAIAGMSAFYFVLHGGSWHHGQVLASNDSLNLQATTACLSAVVAMQVVNVFLCRSPIATAFQTGALSNRLILFGIAVELVLILLIDYTPIGNLFFGTAPISLAVWLFVIPFAVGMLAIEELRKGIVRRRWSKYQAVDVPAARH
jgi:sodium/potassium-transporting ATPase subunit alpha